MLHLQSNFSLFQLNTFGMNVRAAFFSEVNSEEDLYFIKKAEAYKSGIFILGGGSNILFTGNVPSWVLHNRIGGIEKVKEDAEYVWLEIGGGEIWHDIVLYCVKHNFGGIENLSLIPGTVGAAPIQNIGAYGAEVKEVIEEVRFFCFEEEEYRTLDNSGCEFAYRDSIFKRELKNRVMITSVLFKLSKKPRFKLHYGHILQELDKMNIQDLSIKDVSDAVIRIRRSKLPDPKVINNAGSFFKNPEVDADVFEHLSQQYPGMPGYVLAGKRVKIPAAWLIESCGWKGYRKNNFGVHANQALVLVNYGGAAGHDIYRLSEEIMHGVNEKFGIILQREVQIV